MVSFIFFFFVCDLIFAFFRLIHHKRAMDSLKLELQMVMRWGPALALGSSFWSVLLEAAEGEERWWGEDFVL